MYTSQSVAMSSNAVKYLNFREYSDTPSCIKQILSSRLSSSNSLYSKNLLAHFGCVNAIEFSNGGELLISGGDDRRVLLWNVEEALDGASRPTTMGKEHTSNIFCLGFDSKNTKIFSAGNDDQVIVHDALTGSPIDYFLHEQPVYCLSIDPCNDNVFASACDDGRILIYDIRVSNYIGSEPFALAVASTAFHGVTFNPVDSRLLATANARDGAALWDVRKPEQSVLRYGAADSCMSVRWDSQGQRLLVLRRRQPPILYPLHSPSYIAQFDHPSYYNSCTMKSCCFAGDNDQYVLSGSDDFNLYMWRIPDNDPGAPLGSMVSTAQLILGGHRSIVNQVRFNPHNHLIASSGVEKLIKVWSPFPLPKPLGEESVSESNHRRVYSHEDYIRLMLASGQFISHDYSHQSTKEDPRMMAFFDSLVQRDIEGWTSADSEHSAPSGYPVTLIHSDVSSSEDSDSSCDGADTEAGKKTGKTKNAVNNIVELISRKRAQLIRLTQNKRKQDASSDSSDSGTGLIIDCRHTCKRKRKHIVSTSSESERKSTPQSPPSDKTKKTLVWEDEDSSEVTDHDTSSAGKEPSTSSETADSGIVAVLEKPSTSKHKSRPHRNYRRHVPDSDSD